MRGWRGKTTPEMKDRAYVEKGGGKNSSCARVVDWVVVVDLDLVVDSEVVDLVVVDLVVRYELQEKVHGWKEARGR